MSESIRPASWDGSVVLDIGGDVGALILRTTPSSFGREIDVVSDDRSAPQVHSAVRERRTPNGSSFAAVYPQLKEGVYTIEATKQRVTIVGGKVADVVLAERDDALDSLIERGDPYVVR